MASEPPPPSAEAVSGSGGSNSDETEPVELAFWQSVEASDDPKEYQTYLKQFPEGAFAALAKSRLASPAGTSPSADHTVELEFWNSIKDTDVRENFEAYLKKYPEGEFKSLAEIRLRPPSETADAEKS